MKGIIWGTTIWDAKGDTRSLGMAPNLLVVGRA